MAYEVFSKATGTVIATYATEREAHARANAFNTFATRTSGMKRHWSQKAVVRPVMGAALNAVAI